MQSFSYLMGQLISIIVVVFCGHIGEHELAVSGNVSLVCVCIPVTVLLDICTCATNIVLHSVIQNLRQHGEMAAD